MVKILLAGESWVSDIVDHKGYDQFGHTQVHIGCKDLLNALLTAGHSVTHMRSDSVAVDFPATLEELRQYDVVLLSDVGANTLLLPPAVFEQGQRFPNRLKLIRDWVHAGGGLMMAGGYLSFQGFQAMANYAGTAIEDALPVTIHRYDDRIEVPEGIEPHVTDVSHPITKDLEPQWPYLLGYQDLTPKQGANVVATIEDKPLLVTWSYGRGRSLAYASDISPHWASKEFIDWQHYGRLFSNMMTWLAGVDNKE